MEEGDNNIQHEEVAKPAKTECPMKEEVTLTEVLDNNSRRGGTEPCKAAEPGD